MSGTVKPPVQSVEQLINFLVDWHHVIKVEPAELPFPLPRPLHQLYERFGTTASWNNGDVFPVGIFCAQNFLAAANQIDENLFVPARGACSGERMLTFFHENQGSFFLHVPLDRGDDPPVYESDQPQSGALRCIDEKLGSVLALHSLEQAVFSSMGWFRNRRFDFGDYKPRLMLLNSSLYYGNPAIPVDFYIDDSERLLIMNFSQIDMIHIASRGLQADAIFNDFDDVERS